MYQNPLWDDGFYDSNIIDSCWYGKRAILSFFFYIFAAVFSLAFLFAKLTKGIIRRTGVRNYLAIAIGYLPCAFLITWLDYHASVIYGVSMFATREEQSAYSLFYRIIVIADVVNWLLIFGYVMIPLFAVILPRVYRRNEFFWDQLGKKVGFYLKYAACPLAIPFFLFRKVAKNWIMDEEILDVVSGIFCYVFYTAIFSTIFFWQYLALDAPIGDHVWYLQIVAVATTVLWAIGVLAAVLTVGITIIALTSSYVVDPIKQKIRENKRPANFSQEVVESTPGLFKKSLKAIKERSCWPIEVVD